MKEKRCESVRRELEELSLNEDVGVAAAGHLQTCSDCREFQRQQLKLRQIVGSLGTVNAPADFDFRLRARLAADSAAPSFRYGFFAVRGLATAAVLVVFGLGAVVVWQRTHEEPATVAVTPLQVSEPIRRAEVDSFNNTGADKGPVTDNNLITGNKKSPRKIYRSGAADRSKRTVSTVDFSSERAKVVSNTRPAFDNTTVFPIEASLQSVKVSLDDGRGNARTISFPTVSFGSQRVLTTANQLAPKGAW